MSTSTWLSAMTMLIGLGIVPSYQQVPNAFGNYPWGGSQFQQNGNGGGGGNPFTNYGIPNPFNYFNFPNNGFGTNYPQSGGPGGGGNPSPNGQFQPPIPSGSEGTQPLQNPGISQSSQPALQFQGSQPQQAQLPQSNLNPATGSNNPFGSWPYNNYPSPWPYNQQFNPVQNQGNNFWPNANAPSGGQGQQLQQFQPQSNPWPFYNPFYPQAQGQGHQVLPQSQQPINNNKGQFSQSPRPQEGASPVSEIVGPHPPQSQSPNNPAPPPALEPSEMVGPHPPSQSQNPNIIPPTSQESEIVGPHPPPSQTPQREEGAGEVSEILGPHPPRDSSVVESPPPAAATPTQVTEIVGPHPPPLKESSSLGEKPSEAVGGGMLDVRNDKEGMNKSAAFDHPPFSDESKETAKDYFDDTSIFSFESR